MPSKTIGNTFPNFSSLWITMKKLPADTRNNIIGLLESGLSSRKIAERVGVGRVTVDNVRKETMPGAEMPAKGCPPKLSAQDKRRIVRLVTSGKVDTASHVSRELKTVTNVEVSSNTVGRALKEAGLKAIVKERRPRLLSRHIKARYEFALAHQHWTVDDWKRVIWSDETKISRLGSDGREWVWKKRGSAITDQHVQGTVKFGGGSLMLWGCMTASGIGYACRINSMIDSALYTQILSDELLTTLEYYGLERENIIFQQDNAGVHTSQSVINWFENNGIKVLTWPSQSPDLNPIEHLWWHLKGKLGEYESEPTSIHELWERVEREWNAIPAEVCLNLIESMPRRVSAVLKAKGKYTKY